MEWVTTEDISEEAWRRVLEYANTEYAYDAIARKHGRADTKSLKSDYRKQAEQIRVSILQAREYFEAARSSSLFTSPNHLYYGFVSLASAIMLLLGTGDKSLDRLRQSCKNQHHGLELSTGMNHSNCSKGLSLLSQTHVTVMPNGHFINWYQTLPTSYENYALFETTKGSTITTNRRQMGNEELLLPNDIVGNKYNLLYLLSRLPDLHNNLVRYGYKVGSSRVNIDVLDNKNNNSINVRFRIHNASSPSHLLNILNEFKCNAHLYDRWDCTDYENSNGCIALFNIKENGNNHFSYPSIRETINSDQYIYAEYLNTHEMVDFYLALYALSILSRYYPDYWIACLESHCIAAKALEQFVYISRKKGPVMALKFIADDDIIISTHRPSWYD